MWHLQTGSHAEHEALGMFYDKWLDLVDHYFEVCFGRHGRVEGGFVCTSLPYKEGAAENYMRKVATYLQSNDVRNMKEQSNDLVNILEEMTALANKTVYLLTMK